MTTAVHDQVIPPKNDGQARRKKPFWPERPPPGFRQRFPLIKVVHYLLIKEMFGEDAFEVLQECLKDTRQIAPYWGVQFLSVAYMIGRHEVVNSDDPYGMVTNNPLWKSEGKTIRKDFSNLVEEKIRQRREELAIGGDDSLQDH